MFDTARAYGLGEAELATTGLLALALPAGGAGRTARIVTKGGMTRQSAPGCPTAARPSARLRGEPADLDSLPIDTYLLSP